MFKKRKEEKFIRGCGYRKVGGLYVVGSGLGHICDRLPTIINECGCCGEHPRFTRGIAQIAPVVIVGYHDPCKCPKECFVCTPPGIDHAFLMWAGKSYYTPKSFTKEAMMYGASKKIPHIPKNLKVGSIIYVGMKGIVSEEIGYHPQRKSIKRNGIFYAFKVTAFEYLMRECDATDDKVKELNEKGITVVTVPDDDPDHGRGGKSIRKTKKKDNIQQLDEFINPKSPRLQEVLKRAQKAIEYHTSEGE